MDGLQIKPAIHAIIGYMETHSELPHSQVQALREIKRRLERQEVQLRKLTKINDVLSSKNGIKVSFDQENDIVTFTVGDVHQQLKLNRADPNIPIAMDSLTSGTAYHAESTSPDEEEQTLRDELEGELENYYQSAHKVLKLLGTIPELSKIRCEPISRVRNNLIEHTKEGASYTFGVGSTGPRVKPMYEGELVFNDEGLFPNTQAYVTAIVSGCNTVSRTKNH